MDPQTQELEPEHESREVAFGLNATGVAMLVVLTLFCAPVLWLPFVITACRSSERWTRDGVVKVTRNLVAPVRVRKQLATMFGSALLSDVLLLVLAPRAYMWGSDFLMLICLAFAGVLGLVATVLAFRLRRVNAPWVLALAFILSWVALLPGVIALAGVVGAVPRITT